MERLLFRTVSAVNKPVTVVAGCALAFVILVTVADVIMRILGTAVTGTYEMVCFSGGLLVCFSIPLTSWANSQIQVEFLVMKFPPGIRRGLTVITKCLGIVLFMLITWNVILLGNELREAGQVTIVLKIPFYPVAYAMAACGFLQCVVLLCDIVKIVGGKNE
jgi:TRAP-type C4-dicarboxylate transport system permease small subunit